MPHNLNPIDHVKSTNVQSIGNANHPNRANGNANGEKVGASEIHPILTNHSPGTWNMFLCF